MDSLLAQKEIEHLTWINKVSQLWTDPKASQIDVETDEHNCDLGKWLYGDDREFLESSYPDLAVLIKEIESPHHELHASVIEINKLIISKL